MIIDILDELADTTKNNIKKKILSDNADNEVLKEAFRLCYTPQISFNIKKIPEYVPESALKHGYNLEHAMADIHDNFIIGGMRGNSAVEFLKKTLMALQDADAEVLVRIIKRDLRVGASGSSANKTWKGLIKEQPTMLASAYKESLVDAILKKSAYAELKSDGARCMALVDDIGDIQFVSRNGKPYTGLVKIEEQIKSTGIRQHVIDGELVYAPNGIDDVESRLVSNGITNKASNGTISIAEQDGMVFQVWDIIPMDVYNSVENTEQVNMPYKDRKKQLESLVESLSALDAIPWVVVNNKSEVSKVYKAYIDLGLEGIILKDPLALWENKRSKALVKYKEVHTADLRCIAINEGRSDSKFKGMMGSMTFVTDCGKLEVNVGTGFKDADRIRIWEERYTDKSLIDGISELKYNAVVKSKNKELYSLFLPVYSVVRDDKDSANTLEELGGFTSTIQVLSEIMTTSKTTNSDDNKILCI